eukprot:TRINITY_DN3292_c0_g1_i1.p1 TRINITY_DN3292_c0_g1~~TRINITY_DN3292_c0_g1_i1.p1  ORF type:complete len:529 (-),score=81.69 TRINITY_DN3292_c0_g1_i1:158-1744(-)
MILLVNNFTEFYYKKHADLGEKDISIENLFDYKRYVAMSHGCNRPFMEEFVKTQTFTDFIESAYTELGFFSSAKPHKKTDITSFQHGIKEILKHSYDSLLKKQWEKISTSLDKFSHPINVSVADCRLQYEIALRNAPRKSSYKEKGILDHSKIVRMERFALARESTPHIPVDTLNERMRNNKVGQKRTRTQMVPPIQVKKAQSPSLKVFHKKQVTNLQTEKAHSPTQENSLNKFPVKSGKENFIHRKAYSPQLCSKKYSSIDYTLNKYKANCSPKPNSRASFESNRSGSIIGTTMAADRQLAETINQLQKQSHLSHLSNRITTDTIHGTVRMTRGSSNNIFESKAGCNSYTPKQKEVKVNYQQTVKGKGTVFTKVNNPAQNKSRNNLVCTIGTGIKQLMNCRSKKQLNFMSPSLRNQSSGNVASYMAKAKHGLMPEHSKILEEDSEALKTDSPELFQPRTQARTIANSPLPSTPMKSAAKGGQETGKRHNYQATCLNGYGSKSRRGIGISTQVLSHQGDDDVDSFFPY